MSGAVADFELIEDFEALQGVDAFVAKKDVFSIGVDLLEFEQQQVQKFVDDLNFEG